MTSYKYTRSSEATITEQPRSLDNIFQVSPQETIQKTYECDDACLGFGKKYSTTLTNARIIHRVQQMTCCCACGNQDSMLFLSDISYMAQGFENSCRTCGLCDLLLCILTGGLCCLCMFCCTKRAVPITVRGPFGSEAFTFDKNEVLQALSEIPIMALPHKVNGSSPLAPASTFPTHGSGSQF